MAAYSDCEYTETSESELTNGETCDICKDFMTYKCSECANASQDDDICTSCGEMTMLTGHVCACGKHLCVTCSTKVLGGECLFCTTNFSYEKLVDKQSLNEYLQSKYNIINLKKEYILHTCGIQFDTLEELCKRTLWLYNAISKKELLEPGAAHIIRRYMSEHYISA